MLGEWFHPLSVSTRMTGTTSAAIASPEASRSRRRLSVPAKLFITLVVMAGLGTLIYGAIHQSSKNIAEFICYLGIAILASRLKVNLPGITGSRPVLLFLSATVYFIANAGSISTVISLIDRRPLQRIMVDCYFWSFPY